jgi:hypothetical protein
MSGSPLNSDGHLGVMLTELRLPTIKRLAADFCEQSDREGWPARRLLEQLLQHEMNEREIRRFDRHRAESGLDPDKRLSSFDFAAVPTVSKAHVTALVESRQWLDRGANILAFGAPGGGKSHLLSGIGHALVDAGKRVLFMRCSDIVQRLQAARRDLRLPQESPSVRNSAPISTKAITLSPALIRKTARERYQTSAATSTGICVQRECPSLHLSIRTAASQQTSCRDIVVPRDCYELPQFEALRAHSNGLHEKRRADSDPSPARRYD